MQILYHACFPNVHITSSGSSSNVNMYLTFKHKFCNDYNNITMTDTRL